jgi:ankyrin repeat protein
MATEMNDESMARLLLNKGDPIDLRDSMGRTAFMLAVQEQSTEVGSMLIDRGCGLDNSTSLLPELFENADDISPYQKMLQSLQMRLNKEKSELCWKQALILTLEAVQELARYTTQS